MKTVIIFYPPQYGLAPTWSATFVTKARGRRRQALLEAIQIWPVSWPTTEAVRAAGDLSKRDTASLNRYWKQAQLARSRSSRDTFVLGEAVADAEAKASGADPAAQPADPGVDYAQLWDLALNRYAKVQEEYGKIIGDPLNALTHAALFTLGVDHVERFTLAMGEVQDMVSIYPAQPNDAVVERFAGLTRRLERAWTIALDHSTAKSYSWFPPQELEWAKKAEACLKIAQSESATFAERASAAKHAATFFARIETVIFPAAVTGQLEYAARGELQNFRD